MLSLNRFKPELDTADSKFLENNLGKHVNHLGYVPLGGCASHLYR